MTTTLSPTGPPKVTAPAADPISGSPGLRGWVTSYCSWLENRKVSGRACIPGGAQRSRVGVWAGG